MNMSASKKLIESGILELYLLGEVSGAERAEVERMAQEFQEVRQELFALEVALEKYALSEARTVDPTIKPFLMATVKYMERMGAGEKESFPAKLHSGSKIDDYRWWLDRPDLGLNEPLDEIDAHIIGSSEGRTTAIVWIKNGAPPEVHKRELETFLIVEGTCNIVVDGKDNHLKPGDVFSIPLHLSHYVIITSDVACKLILERCAA
jgi:mannose-6-phosphate isomerase-like protein (cupin superfamily)